MKPPPFLVELLDARSPSGYEGPAQQVIDRYMEKVADDYQRDPLGQRFAAINLDGDPVLMFAGHMDELGLIIRHVDDNGYLYFDTIGGHDKTIISGRRVVIETKNGQIPGVTGKRAVHLMSPDDRKKVPELHEIWIDIGVTSRDEALEVIRLGDVATYDHGFAMIRGSVGVARAFDDKAGAYIVNEATRRLQDDSGSLAAKVVSVTTTQEEVGVRGATVAGYAVNPHIGIAVDVGHATDHPDADHRKFGRFKLGGGPILTRGANINPWVFERLVDCAESASIPYQIEADPRPTGTDGRAIQVTRGGVATGIIHLPLRYMHTPSELVDLEDVESCVKLLVTFAKSLEKGDRGIW